MPRFRIPLFTIAFAWFSGYATFSVVNWAGQDFVQFQSSLLFLFSALITLLSSGMIAYSIATSSIQFLSALFWTFQYVFFGLVSLSYSMDTLPYNLARINVSNDALYRAAVLNLIACSITAFSQLYFYISQRTPSDIRAHDHTQSELIALYSRARRLALVYLLILPFVLSQLGGIPYLFKKGAQSFQRINQIDNFELGIYQSLLTVIPMLVVLVFLTLKIDFGFKVSLLLLVSFSIWLLILSNPIAHPRQHTLFLLFTFVYFISIRSRKFAIITLFSTPIVITLLGNIINRFTGNIQLSPEFVILSRVGDFDAFPLLASGITLSNDENFPIFKQIFGSLLFFVPRNLWGEKPLDTGVVLGELNGLKFRNLSAPWTLEAFVNARYLGVVLVSLLMGYFLSRFASTLSSAMKFQILLAFVAGSVFILLRGSLLQATGRIVFAILLTLFLFRNPYKVDKNGRVSLKEVGL